jgi:GNAT superfamily N-acetyltransferase
MGAEGDLAAARLARGCRCFAAWLGAAIVGYGWLSTKAEWVGELELEIAPDPGDAYLWNCVTLTPHRRQGVFRSLVASVVTEGRQEGSRRIWIATLDNLAENAVVRAGFFPVIRFATTSRVGFRWLKITPVQGVDRDLMAAALRAIRIKPGSSLRRSQRRRH